MLSTLKIIMNEPSFRSRVKCMNKHYGANEKIFHQGKIHTRVCIVLEGRVRILVRPHKDDMPIHPGIAELGPGEIFGEFAIFDDLPACADVVSIKDSLICEIDIVSFREYIKQQPTLCIDFIFQLNKMLAQRLRHTNHAMITLYAWGIKSHHIDHLLK